MSIEQVIQRIIDHEIYVSASVMVQDLLNDPDGTAIDDLAPCLSVPDFSEPPEGYTVLRDARNATATYVWRSEDTQLATEDGFATRHDAIMAAWENSGNDPEHMEALQFWLVSDWLADKLESVNAPVARDVLGFNVWGRTECGQSMTLDGSLRAIAELLDS